MTTSSPGASLSLAALVSLLAVLSAEGSGSLLVQPTSTAVVASRAPLAMRIRFSGVVGRTDMYFSFRVWSGRAAGSREVSLAGWVGR
jgi:hypothetical protein